MPTVHITHIEHDNTTGISAKTVSTITSDKYSIFRIIRKLLVLSCKGTSFLSKSMTVSFDIEFDEDI